MDESYGLYVHVPFCLSKCPYCSFFSIPTDSQLQTHYMRALLSQIKMFSSDQWCLAGSVGTIFFGGGTPTTLATMDLITLLTTLRQSFHFFTDSVETSFEVNPATLAEHDLQALRKAGFNRISIGVQSFSDPQLQQLGRAHTVQEAKDLVIAARQAGFDNLSLDLMYGLPGSKSADWQKTLHQAVDLCPDHLSLYELTLEQGTPFHERACSGTLIIPSEEDILEMMTITSEILTANGFHRYEISNYAKLGRTCRHNINYWQNGSYLGLGAGAVSCFSGIRCRSIEDVNLFCRAISEKQIHWSETEALDQESSFRETVIMGLRMIQGVSLSDLKDRYHLDPITYYGLTLQNLIDKNLLELGNNSLRLTDKGLSLANTVMAELV